MIATLFLAALVAIPTPPPAPTTPGAEAFAGLLAGTSAALHRCDGDLALSLAEQAAELDPDHPGPWVLRAAACSLQAGRTREEAWKARASDARRHAYELSRRRVEAPRGPEDLYWVGQGFGLMAVEHAEAKEWLTSIRLGKRMRSAGHQALRLDPEFADAHLLTGIYDYLATELPSVLKPLRFLLFLPGGDKARGIRSLKLAFEEGDWSSTQAGLYLQQIFLHEEEYEKAVELGRSIQASERPLGPSLMLLAKTYLKAGRLEEADSLLAGTDWPSHPCMLEDDLWEASFLRAVTLLKAGRFEEAGRILRVLTDASTPEGVSKGLRARLLWARAVEADARDDRTAASDACAELLAMIPQDSRWRGTVRECLNHPASARDLPLWF